MGAKHGKHEAKNMLNKDIAETFIEAVKRALRKKAEQHDIMQELPRVIDKGDEDE